jgi:phosphonate transport system substrate-binding protein
MKIIWTFLIASLAALVVGAIYWMGPGKPPLEPAGSSRNTPAPTSQPMPALRIGVVPERDIFVQSKRFKALAIYLSQRLGRPVEMVTVNTYEAVLQDFSEKKIDAAFLGSLVAVLAADRLNAKVLVKPEHAGGVSTYRGVVFVKEDSPIKSIADLADHSIAMVRTTTAGNLYPCCLLVKNGLMTGGHAPKIVWSGTHDDVAMEVMEGRADAGAIKDLRLDDMLRSNPQWKIRRLATSEAVPDNALVAGADMPADLRARLSEVLMKMDGDDRGRKVLLELDLKRYVPCSAQEYGPIYDMIDQLGAAWDRIGVAGRPPRRPATGPA